MVTEESIMSNIQHSSYVVHCIDTIDNPLDDYVDVEVTFTTGERYIGSFFTLVNIQRVMELWKKTGENLLGTYFWCAEMIIVREITIETIEATIKDLIISSDFEKVFMKCTDEKE